MKTYLSLLFLAISVMLSAQQKDIPVDIKLHDGTTISAKHFGQLKCSKESYVENYIYIKGKFQGSVTEMKDYSDIREIVLVNYTAEPNASAGNEKGKVLIIKKDGVKVELEEAEIFMTCYGVGDKYNTLVVQMNNPITNQATEKDIPTKDIQSIVFK